jgi:hypothetical protein
MACIEVEAKVLQVERPEELYARPVAGGVPEISNFSVLESVCVKQNVRP